MFRFLQFTIVFSALLLALAHQALAQKNTASESEKAVFGFFKTANKTPDYEQWILTSPTYLDAASNQKAEVFEQELLRLKWGFGLFEPEEDLLKIKTDILLQLQETAKGASLNFKFPTSAQEEIPYFPYPYGQEWLALILNDLGNFTSITLTADEYQTVKQHLGPGKVHAGKMKIRPKPIAADHTAPMSLHGTKQWLMMGEIAYLEFTYMPKDAEQEALLWSYTAPWYLSETEKILLPLLEE